MLPALHSVQANPVKLAEPIDADGRQWAMLLPAGEFSGRDGRGPYRMDDAEKVIAASFDAANTGSLPVDVNHSIDRAGPKGQPAPAAGWISRMEARADGVWGFIEWTARAAQSIRDKEYRFLSPVFLHSAQAPYKVVYLARASLTNDPNLTLTALHTTQKGKAMDETQLAELRTLLQLADSADGAAIVAGVRKSLESRNTADPSQFVPIAMFQQTVSELNKLRTDISLEEAQRTVDGHMRDGHLMPHMRDWAVSLCQSNPAHYKSFLEGAGKPVKQLFDQMTGGPMIKGQPPARRETQLSAIHATLGLSAEDLKLYGEGDKQ